VRTKKAKRTGLAPYVARLTFKARPMFSTIMCLLLAFTSFITFSLLGTFIVSLDDSSTRIYNSNAFLNGDSDRMVVVRQDGGLLTEEDYREIVSVKYAETLERWGYVNDISYYYRPDVDYYIHTEIVNGPNYHSLLNPDDYQVTNVAKFLEQDLYFRTVPVTAEGLEYSGELPCDVYEVLSADSNYKIGDKIRVFFRNRSEWSVSSYIDITLTVVGETDVGSGLYFSDSLAAALGNYSSWTSPESAIFIHGYERIIVLPYDADSYTIAEYWEPSETGVPLVKKSEDGKVALGDNEICTSKFLAGRAYIDLGGDTIIEAAADGKKEVVTLKAFVESQNSRLVLVSDRIFESLNDMTPDNQASLYIKDYAYTDRVVDSLESKGYIAISPFRIGATYIDPELASERMTTLGVCLGALVLIIVLQLILFKAMFSSLNEHFRLMSNIGLTAKTAYGALSLLLVAFGFIGEIIGASAVLLLNEAGVHRIVSIFKFLEADNIAALFAVHIVSVCFAFVSVVSAMKKNVFTVAKHTTDIDLSDMEEV
jgi:hypothetical protein